MATVAGLSLSAGIGLVILIVIIVVIIIAIRNARGDSPSSSSGSSDWIDRRRRKYKNDHRYRVKGAIENDEERFEVEHARHTHKKKHHKCKDSHSKSSSSSSSSDSKSKSHSDDFCFRQGGLGDICLIGQDCAIGLTCLNGRCVCPTPAATTITPLIVNPTTRTAIVNWTPVIGANVYRLVLRRTDPASAVDEVTLTNPATTSFTFNNLELGVSYFVEITTGSSSCGFSPTAQRVASAPFTIPCGPVPGPVNGVDLTLGPVTGTTRPVTLTWEAVPGADRYSVLIQDIGDGTDPAVVAFFGEITTTTITRTLTVDTEYSLIIAAISDNCGTSATPFSGTVGVPPAPIAGPPPAPTTITSVVSPTIVNGQREVVVNWTPVVGATRYRVTVTETIAPGQTRVLLTEFEPSTSITFLFSPGDFRVDVSTVSNDGTSTTPATTNFTVAAA